MTSNVLPLHFVPSQNSNVDNFQPDCHNPFKTVFKIPRTLTQNYLFFQFKPNADPALFINPEQPLIAATSISNEDIEKQEQKVLEMRKKLAEAIEALSG